ncbi:MAG TPA: mandelate racemase/muconate lactonizing enzyme family protein [Streptosporangiaceae bacterium]|nr:mandelate racemase/muconate lactonizing enzyme family protein [Streptosporangiaceae bacterium]
MALSSDPGGLPQAADLGTVVELRTVRWAAQPNLLWVQVLTSAGAVGLGETYYLPGAVESVLHDLAADLVIGQPAGAITRTWQTIFSCTNFFGYAGAEMRALSALDMALWDALGQATGVPVCQLLGGAVRDTMPVYNTCVNAGPHSDWDLALADPGTLAADLQQQGYLGMKVWPWDRFAPQVAGRGSTGPAGWSAMGPMGSYLSPADLETGLSMLTAARDRVGTGIELLVEGHSRWDINMAIRIARAVEPLGVLWAEDLCQPDSPQDLARLARETRVPQAVSERLISRFPFREVLREQAAHVVLLDVAWTGGITEARRIADAAGTYHLPFAPHDCTGPVTALANVHLAAAMPNCLAVEVVRGFIDGYYREVLDQPLSVVHGTVAAPSRPGLGAALAPDFTARPDVTVRVSA